MNTKIDLRRVGKMLLIGITLILIFASLALTGCHRHNKTTVVEGTQGEAGTDGVDGTDGLGFGFVRDIDGSSLTSSYWIGDASCVVPQHILEAAPADDDPREGIILYLGGADEFSRYYLLAMPAGSYCVVDREEYEELGTLDFASDGHLAVVELSTLQSLELFSEIVDKGIVVEIDEPVLIDAKRTELRIGSIRIRMFGRN